MQVLFFRMQVTVYLSGDDGNGGQDEICVYDFETWGQFSFSMTSTRSVHERINP